MKKILFIFGVTLPLLFLRLNSFAFDYYSKDTISDSQNYHEFLYGGQNNNAQLIETVNNTDFIISCHDGSSGYGHYYWGLISGSHSSKVLIRITNLHWNGSSWEVVNSSTSEQSLLNGNSFWQTGTYYSYYPCVVNFTNLSDAMSFYRSFNPDDYNTVFSYDTSSSELVFPTGYFRESGSNGAFSNILVLDNKPDNARVLVDYRWHSIDDINIQTSFWSRKFDISYNTTVNSTRYNFKEWSDNFTDTVIDLNDTFENPFLVSFPVEDRTFHYLNKNGQETTFAAISANTVHQSIIAALNSPNSIYNSLDIFVAYAYKEGNVVHVSKWSQFYRDLQGNLNGVTSSDVGFIESGQASQNSFHYVYDMTNQDKNTTSIINDYGNPNAQTVVNNIFDTSQFDTTQTIQNLNQSYQGIFQMVQNVPQMFSQLLSFLPSWVTTLLAVSIGLLVIVGLIKALL